MQGMRHKLSGKPDNLLHLLEKSESRRCREGRKPPQKPVCKKPCLINRIDILDIKDYLSDCVRSSLKLLCVQDCDINMNVVNSITMKCEYK